MTAIIGVMNKHAVAIAADSAVTIGGGRKVLNSANKLFSLSKHHPVAIAIYGNAELVGTPWEIIIKEYRKILKEKSFSHVSEYVNNFFDFIKKKQYYCYDTTEALNFLKLYIKGFCLDLQHNVPSTQLTQVFTNICNNINPDYLEGFTDNTKDFLYNNVSTELDICISELKKSGLTLSNNDAKDLLVNLLTKGILPTGLSGLVFTGYGEEEIYPSVFSCEVGCIIDGVLAIRHQIPAKISNANDASICPFAQTDVMHTILSGISPQVQSIYANSLATTIRSFTQKLATAIMPNNSILAKQIQGISIEPFIQTFMNLSQQAQFVQYTSPFVKSVASLEKEDLSDFAESLITLTSLKRKVSPDQETVGGPVDVMVISKGDGLIWMKRKHYFEAGKNHHFFSNYFEN
ncbi:MAG: hypothetical protein IK004_04750 [Bacteroidales bacterium]|nr:hypothetical protein [Bacteroidales bacterium]